MYDDNSTGSPEKYTKEQFQKMEKERFAAEARENAERDKAIEKRKGDVQKYIDEIPKRKAEAEQRMKDYKEGNAKSMGQFNANMQKIGDAHDVKMKELRDTTKSGGGGGGGGSMTDPMDRKTKPYNKAKGGIIKSSASKRADGIAQRGKTRGRII